MDVAVKLRSPECCWEEHRGDWLRRGALVLALLAVAGHAYAEEPVSNFDVASCSLQYQYFAEQVDGDSPYRVASDATQLYLQDMLAEDQSRMDEIQRGVTAGRLELVAAQAKGTLRDLYAHDGKGYKKCIALMGPVYEQINKSHPGMGVGFQARLARFAP